VTVGDVPFGGVRIARVFDDLRERFFSEERHGPTDTTCGLRSEGGIERLRAVVASPGAKIPRSAKLAVLVAALGYLVDIYDLILFSVVRIPSLRDLLGAESPHIDAVGQSLLNWQMTGMLIGGILWGILGDKRGRLSVLFGSILLYSIANIANGFVTDATTYGWLRLIAGIGLAGELGAGITLVSELLDARQRGWATTLVAGVGICGALLAVGVSKIADWRVAYWIGGGLGLCLLVLRLGVLESGMFAKVREKTEVSRGNFFKLFAKPKRALRYLAIVLVGVPIWYAIGILVTFSNALGTAMGMRTPPDPAIAVFFAYLGLAIGDFGAGWLSQILKSRRRALLAFIALNAIAVTYYFTVGKLGSTHFYAGCLVLGIANGYWAVFVTIAAEQFGTNLRATAATTAPNFVRGSLVPVSLSYTALAGVFGAKPIAAAVVGTVVIGVSALALFLIEETYGKDLDFVED
jgi:MFS transporter, putative metabolite:H+ symporter